MYRDGEPVDVTIRLGEAPINEVSTVVADRPVLASERLGIQVEAMTPEIAKSCGWPICHSNALKSCRAESRGSADC